MAVTPKKIYHGSPGITEETIFTVESGRKIILKNIILANMTEEDAFVHIYLKPAGEDLAANHEILSPTPVAPVDTRMIECSIVLEAGDSLVVKQSVSNALNIYLSGVEVV